MNRPTEEHQVCQGTYGDSYITLDGIKAIIDINGKWYARTGPYPSACGYPNPQSAIDAARDILGIRPMKWPTLPTP